MKILLLLLLFLLVQTSEAVPPSHNAIVSTDFKNNESARLQYMSVIDGFVAMDSVLNIPATKEKVTVNCADIGYYGSYALGIIHISTKPGKKQLFTTTIIHEYGHFIEDKIIIKEFGKDPELKPVYNAVMSSMPVILTQVRQGVYKDIPELKSRSDYLLKPTELFARAFTQYIAIRSENPILRKEFNLLLNLPDNGQWTHGEFQPIAAAFDTYFKKKYWTKSLFYMT